MVADAGFECDLLEHNDAVLVGLSGGPDSVALLWCLCRLAPKYGLRIGAAHLNHDLRGDESICDAEFAAACASRLEIPFYTETIRVSDYRKRQKLGIEEAARKARYDFLEKTAIAHGYNRLALAHHADDNAELVLMNLLRGSGSAGLSGIPEKRLAKGPHGQASGLMIIRPLLRVSKEEIFTFLNANHLQWRTDRTNLDTAHLRNRIRHELLPALRKNYNPNIAETLNRFALLAATEEAWVTQTLGSVFNDLILRKDARSIRVSIPGLRRQPDPVVRRVLRQAVRHVKGDLRRISFHHVAAVMTLCRSEREKAALHLPDRLRIEKAADALIISRSPTSLREIPAGDHAFPLSPPITYRLDKPGSMRLSGFGMRISAEVLTGMSSPDYRNAGHLTAFFDMEDLTFPLLIRNYRSGDAFRPLGTAGTQKLKKFFIDHKVPAPERARVPIIECAGRIIWVAGHRIDERVKITGSTRRILKIQLALAEYVNSG